MFRLSPQTPLQIALEEVLRPTRRPVGRPRSTWISQMHGDLALLGLDFEAAIENASNRQRWRELVRRAMSES